MDSLRARTQSPVHNPTTSSVTVQATSTVLEETMSLWKDAVVS
jgi:hypothetical protein